LNQGNSQKKDGAPEGENGFNFAQKAKELSLDRVLGISVGKGVNAICCKRVYDRQAKEQSCDPMERSDLVHYLNFKSIISRS
jgi:hypothetical protein